MKTKLNKTSNGLKNEPKNILVDKVAVIKVKNEVFALEAVGNYIIVQEDDFKTGYECTMCEGRQHTDKKCNNCKGRGTEKVNNVLQKCRACNGLGYEKCPNCNGTGGLLIAPQNAERRPTRGKVLSCGPQVEKIHAGDHVLYSNHSGHVYEFGMGASKVAIRYLREIELLCKFHLVKGGMSAKPFEDLQEVGIS